MTEYIEMRLSWPEASEIFHPDDGDLLSDTVFRILVRSDDPRIPLVADLDRRLWRTDSLLLYSCDIRRRYTAAELAAARAFELWITAAFEPVGEDCGTVHDLSAECATCGAGRVVRGGLRLDLARLPKTKDIAQSIAGDEWVVSQPLAEAIVNAGLTGIELQPVSHRRSDTEWESMTLTKYSAGRELLRRASKAGFEAEDPHLWIWVQREEQRPLLDRLYAELDDRAARSLPGRRFRPWYRMVPAGNPVVVDRSRTRCGVNPVSGHYADQQFACGHILGLNILSELHVDARTWTNDDFAVTDGYINDRRGVLVPRPLLVISQRFRAVLEGLRVRGYRLEVAHLV